ncbi:tyrosine-protein phosphatase [Actibacterium sp. 188UL27-1]|uniref:tyrosine-protein phosphatase n=1 Tax=Actibacterium sp. 188UL27-1 TaxID=2786961 RepID=UPI00195A21A9|nr:tyrosine-protein phosphatase [Actibacterium sp. 188UL27-1]MBM7068277.1 tyrosine-protein phosphatase [Actibacterium sp. 188UL27-1]
MFTQLRQRLKTAERKVRKSFGDDISTPFKRWQAWLHFHLLDHAFLRVWWTNFGRVADGVYRSNHPGPKRLKKYKSMGIQTVLNLRGNDGYSPWLFEQEACDRLGLTLVERKIYARKAAGQQEILNLIDTLKTLPKPFVLHCKSGADRAGFAAVLYRAIVEKVPLSEARKELSVRYLHLDWTATGIVDHIFDVYEKRNAQDPIDLETWFRTEYNKREVEESFAAWRKGTS